jgi:hypothetical protein
MRHCVVFDYDTIAQGGRSLKSPFQPVSKVAPVNEHRCG